MHRPEVVMRLRNTSWEREFIDESRAVAGDDAGALKTIEPKMVYSKLYRENASRIVAV